MKKIKPIQLKAAFLLIVFSLNTIIGFACAVGLDMGFNSHHQEESSFASASIHHHGASVQKHQTKNDKDNCCNGEVMKFQKIDKALASSINVVNPVSFTSYVASFYNIDILSAPTQILGIKYFVRSHHPPIPDIRIAIRSFQI
ncbi:MAG: hypothetical protein Q8891_09560 [Bacteroidota bacterium]|nr:hypothetical protein [Bacteroidota bacterium]